MLKDYLVAIQDQSCTGYPARQIFGIFWYPVSSRISGLIFHTSGWISGWSDTLYPAKYTVEEYKKLQIMQICVKNRESGKKNIFVKIDYSLLWKILTFHILNNEVFSVYYFIKNVELEQLDSEGRFTYYSKSFHLMTYTHIYIVHISDLKNRIYVCIKYQYM